MSQTASKEEILAILRQSQCVHLGPCPLCERDDWEFFGDRNHNGLPIEYWICPGCGLVGQSPHLQEEILPDFYRHYYRLLYEGSATPTAEEVDFQRRRGRNILEHFRRAAGRESVGDILDVGCSAGGLLNVAKEEFGAAGIVGVEHDEGFGARAREVGAEVFAAPEEIERNTDYRFDVITLSHVLEHVYDVTGLLRQLRGLLREDGYLCIEVPHTCQGACFEITHLWGFNEASLERLLVNGGFQTAAMTTHGYPRAPESTRRYLLTVARRTDRVPPPQHVTTPYRERFRRYAESHPNATHASYNWRRAKNTLKQLLGRDGDRRTAHTFLPPRLGKRRA